MVTDGNFNGGNVASSVKADDMVDYVPQHADLLKDEVNWPIGKCGYHEPPKNVRNYSTPDSKNHPDRYRIAIHSDVYGDLEMQYNPENGRRTLFKAGMSSDGRLMSISPDVKKTNAELLADLEAGDKIANYVDSH